MKKLFFIMLFSLSVVACGGGDGQANTPTQDSIGEAAPNGQWGAKWDTELTWQ